MSQPHCAILANGIANGVYEFEDGRYVHSKFKPFYLNDTLPDSEWQMMPEGFLPTAPVGCFHQEFKLVSNLRAEKYIVLAGVATFVIALIGANNILNKWAFK